MESLRWLFVQRRARMPTPALNKPPGRHILPRRPARLDPA
jgi:hypothetical protein